MLGGVADYYAERERQIAALDRLKGRPLHDALNRLADLAVAHDDPEDAAGWVDAALQVANDEGDFPRQFAAFDRLRRLRDDHPKIDAIGRRVRWYYKWIVDALPYHAQVSRTQIEQMFDAMAAEYGAAGEGPRPVEQLRCRAALHMGEPDRAADHFAAWEAAQGSATDDCPACVTDFVVHYHLARGETATAWEAAGPVLRFEQTCDEVPAVTVARLLTPALGGVPVGTLHALHRMTRRQARKVPGMVDDLGRHALFLTLIGRTDEARRLLPTLLRRAEASGNELKRLAAFAGAWTTLARSAAVGVMAKLPPELGIGDDPAAAAAWAGTRAASAAEALDARNGNTYRSGQLRDLHAVVTG